MKNDHIFNTSLNSFFIRLSYPVAEVQITWIALLSLNIKNVTGKLPTHSICPRYIEQLEMPTALGPLPPFILKGVRPKNYFRIHVIMHLRYSEHRFSCQLLPISKLFGGAAEASYEFHLNLLRLLAYLLINCCSIRLWYSNSLKELMQLLKQVNCPCKLPPDHKTQYATTNILHEKLTWPKHLACLFFNDRQVFRA